MQLGNLALDKERDLVGVQAAGEIIEGHFYDILTDLFRVVGIVGEGLHVCDEDEHAVIISLVLQEHAVTQAANIMSQMQFAGRAVAGKDDSSHISCF